MRLINQAKRLPETDLNYIMGHGGFSIEQMQTNDRIRHAWEFISPRIKKQNAEYYEKMKYEIPLLAGEHVARLHYGLRRNHSLSKGANLKLYLAGEGYSAKFPDFAFSDITAHATVTEEATESYPERINWGLFVVNAYNKTRNLLYMETSMHERTGVLDKVEAVDIQTGASYLPQAYSLEGEARLYQTASHIIDRLDFAVNFDTDRVIVTEVTEN